MLLVFLVIAASTITAHADQCHRKDTLEECFLEEAIKQKLMSLENIPKCIDAQLSRFGPVKQICDCKDEADNKAFNCKNNPDDCYLQVSESFIIICQ